MKYRGLSVPSAILGGMSNGFPSSLQEKARFQAGVITRQQALRSGLSASAIKWQLTRGNWRQIYLGVYATFSGPAGRDAQLRAAVLYAGKGAQLSHETAAEVNGLTERQSALINVSIPADRRVSPPNGVKVHLSAYLDLKARFPRGVVPHTLVEETIIDLVDARDIEGQVAAAGLGTVGCSKGNWMARKLWMMWSACSGGISASGSAGSPSIWMLCCSA
jgi:hypothetical protein